MAKTAVFAVAFAAAFLGGCAVTTAPLTDAERQQRAEQDLSVLFGDQVPVTAPISLEEAVARAIQYNLNARTRMMEVAIAQGVAEVASYDLLPKVAASAGYAGRSNRSATNSLNLGTNAHGTDYSTSLDRDRQVANLSVAWNVLDFGLSYLRARQENNRVLVAAEQRRKVIHNLIQDTRSTFWRAVVAERLKEDLDPLLVRVRAALRNARRIEESGVQSPIQALDYQRSLLDTLYELQSLRRDLSTAKVELAALINVPPGEDFMLVLPPADEMHAPEVPPRLDMLEQVALTTRPELREEDYQARISADETRKAMRRMLPGLEFSVARQYDSNSYALNNAWTDTGLKLTWNLLNVFSGPANIRQAETREERGELRRLSMSMAVISQVHIAYQRLALAKEDLEVLTRMLEVDDRISRHAAAAEKAATQNELEKIRRDANRLLSRLRRDMAFVESRNAAGALMVSVGIDPVADLPPVDDLPALTASVGRTLRGWSGAAGVGTPEWVIDEMPSPGVAAPVWRIDPLPSRGVAEPEWTIGPLP